VVGVVGVGPLGGPALVGVLVAGLAGPVAVPGVAGMPAVATVHAAAAVAATVHCHEEHDQGDPQPVGNEVFDHDSPLRPDRTRTGVICMWEAGCKAIRCDATAASGTDPTMITKRAAWPNNQIINIATPPSLFL
jgi:hypothetical protein